MARRAKKSDNGVEEIRRVVHCSVCQLVQFETKNGRCRRCAVPLPIHKSFGKDRFAYLLQVLRTSVQAYREAAGMRLCDVADTAKVSRSTVGRLESGNAICGLTEIEKVAAGLHVPLQWLFELTTEDRLNEVFAVRALLTVRKYQVRKGAVLFGVHRLVENKILKKAG